MVEVVPITITVTDWSRLLSAASRYLDRNIASVVDSSRSEPKTLASFLSMIESLAGSEIQPQAVIAAGYASLRHISFGFLIWSDIPKLMIDFMAQTAGHLAVTLGKERTMMVVTGNLEDWKWLIISKAADERIMNPICGYLQQAGFRNLWSKQLK